MPKQTRREWLCLVGAGGVAGLAGCSSSEDDSPESTPEEEVSVVLPPDSRELFVGGVLNPHIFAESTFTEDQVGTPVSEFDLENADASSVENMRKMFQKAESFNQDIGGWCVEQIGAKPIEFNNDAGFEGDDAKQPNWGEPC